MPDSAIRSTFTRKMRFAALFIVVIILFWLPVEDVHVRTVVLLAMAVSVWIGVRFLSGVSLEKEKFLIKQSLIGLLCGLTVSPVAIGLMAFKTGLHGHDVPDFTPEQIQTVIWLAPIFGVSGLFIGLGAGLLRKSLDYDASQS